MERVLGGWKVGGWAVMMALLSVVWWADSMVCAMASSRAVSRLAMTAAWMAIVSAVRWADWRAGEKAGMLATALVVWWVVKSDVRMVDWTVVKSVEMMVAMWA